MPPNTILSPKLNTSHPPEFKYLDRHSHYLTHYLLNKSYYIIRKRIGASIYCVIPQLGDLRYSDLMRLSSIFLLVFVEIFCYIAVNRLKLSRINFQVAKRKSTSSNYQKSRLETSHLEINYGHFDL